METDNIRPITIALTADLHYGTRHEAGNRATLELVADLVENSPDVLILAGDIGAGEQFGRCLSLFEKLSCLKIVTPGNHDIWVNPDDERGDSWQVYTRHLPMLCAQHNFHYLDHAPSLLPDSNLAIVGNINWYDYSFSIDQLRDAQPDWEYRLRTKRFRMGSHNDARFVRWELDDIRFTDHLVENFSTQLKTALNQVKQAMVVMHHPPARWTSFQPKEHYEFDQLLWLAFSGNTRIESLLKQYQEQIPLVFCGHTHRAFEGRSGKTLGYNIGGDYNSKRLLRVYWPENRIEAKTFG